MQYAALPWRYERGALQVLLVTSLGTGRWIVPKGWPIPRLAAFATAAREAFEEAGVRGEISTAVVGHFHYLKHRKTRRTQLCRVNVYALRVDEEVEDWLERGERTRKWFAPESAAEAVAEPELKALILDFAAVMKL